MSVDLEKMRELLRGRVLLFCHHNADPDAVCSAYSLKGLIESLGGSTSAEIVLTGGASRISRRIMKVLGIEAVEQADLREAAALVVLDTANLSQLDDLGEEMASVRTPKIFIDHHAPTDEVRKIATIFVVDEESTSTCGMVYRLFRDWGIKPTRDVAKALLIGMAYDSKHLTIGNPEMFRTVSELLEMNGPLQDVMALLTASPERPERIARLKAAQRTQIREQSGWMVAASHVSSYQASAARGLISLGADVAIVAGSVGGLIKASLRSTERFTKETGIHLGRDLAMQLGREFGGAGSGHSSAAGVNAKGRVSPFLRRAVDLAVETIDGKAKSGETTNI